MDEKTLEEKIKEVLDRKYDERWEDWIRERDDPAKAGMKPEALDDIMVLDLSYKNFAGIFCSSLLAEWGAEVVRIEPPSGDMARLWTPYGYMHKDVGLAYLNEGRNKYHITLNLELQEGREIFKDLAAKADVIIETFKPGTMDNWGIGYRVLRDINPGLIYAAITGYGQFGPRSGSNMPDYDVTAQANSGIMSACGEPLDPSKPPEEQPWAAPTKTGNWMAWYATGGFTAGAIICALMYRRLTGRGQMLDCSTAEAYHRLDIGHLISLWEDYGKIHPRTGGLDYGLWLYGFFNCKDQTVFLGAISIEMWYAFADAMGKLDEWGPSVFQELFQLIPWDVQQKMFPEVEKETRKYTFQELLKKSLEYSKTGRYAPRTFAIGPVQTPAEVYKEDNWWKRGVFQKVKDPVYGEVVVAKQAPLMEETPPRIKWVCRPVGYDNQYIYSKHLGYGPKKLKELKEKGVI
jgi:crotonobetainyl-CoA:carnitine CoA-transferase CaiB-like acyl-CoA transferase